METYIDRQENITQHSLFWGNRGWTRPSIISTLSHDVQFYWWRKPEYLEKTTIKYSLQQVKSYEAIAINYIGRCKSHYRIDGPMMDPRCFMQHVQSE